ncbi:MAG: preprotein translocase subunit SecE [Patescibacteria group bacterium]|nr:preprotein translocase subunit SecE [Patescibacteria group bacterium]
MFQKIKVFLIESRQEFKRVNWPTLKQTRRYTFFVIMLALGLSIFLGILDFIFLETLKNLF